MNEFKAIGRILKSKGFDGTSIAHFTSPCIDPNFRALFIQKGVMYQPLLIERCEWVDDTTAHIKWKGYDSKEQVSTLHNRELYLDEKIALKHFKELEEEDLIGYEMYVGEEKFGTVIGIYETPQQETMEIQLLNDKKLLVPLIEEYVITIDDEKEIIYCELSNEYIDIFSS